MKMKIEDVVGLGKSLFDKRIPLLSMWQSIADNFYPIRGDFTLKSVLGREFASHLSTTTPVLAHRDLSSSISSILRRDQWFDLQTDDEVDTEGKRWMAWARERQYKLMYMRNTGFVRATKEGDGDFAAFGQCAISVEKNRFSDGLQYRCHHLRDIVWSENHSGECDTFFRKSEISHKDVIKMFGDKAHNDVKKLGTDGKTAYEEMQVWHIIMPAEVYDDSIQSHEYVSLFVDPKRMQLMEELPYSNKYYILPRFQTISGSQYAYSPAAIAALPEARTIQSMSSTLLEAGERFVNPPLVATKGAIRGDVNVYPSGITWVDQKYDEKLGEVLRPLTQDRSGFPIGFEMKQEVRELINEAFYLNKLTLPNTANMTAYEVEKRMQEFVRMSLPLFQPLEDEYNGQLCELTFDLLMDMNLLGSVDDIPDSLKGRRIDYKFKSPISEAAEKSKGAIFNQNAEMLLAAAQIDPSSLNVFNTSTALRDALEGVGAAPTWLRDEEETQALIEQQKMMEQAQQLTEMANNVPTE